MVRQIASSLFALLVTVLLFAGTSGPVQAEPAYYRAEPATAPTAERVVARDIVWKCGPTGCVAGRSNSRPAIDCAGLARRVGALRSFSVAGAPLAAGQLEKCNARAR